MINYKVKSVKNLYVSNMCITSFVFSTSETEITMKLRKYNTYVVKKVPGKKKTDFYVDILEKKPIGVVELVLESNLNEELISVNLKPTILHKALSYTKEVIYGLKNVENAINTLFHGNLEDIYYAIDNLEYLPSYELVKVTGWAFSEYSEISFTTDKNSRLLGYINYRREDVSKIYEIKKNIGFEAILSTDENSDSVCCVLDCLDRKVEIFIDKMYLNQIVDAESQRKSAEKYYISAPYIHREVCYQESINAKKVDVIVACNSEKWLRNILLQTELFEKSNMIIVSNSKFKDEFTEICNENQVVCKLLFGDVETEEELRCLAVQNSEHEYCMFLGQEDTLEIGHISYLYQLISNGKDVSCSDYDLVYNGKNIVRIIRTLKSWMDENPELLIISCMVRTKLIKEANNYYDLLQIIKSAGEDKGKLAVGNQVGYHYNCVADVWGRESDYMQIAFYLTQYHENEENNKWWGEGFTEWTNVKKGTPMFKGHNQPRIPRDLGYYDLVEERDILSKQCELAKTHGIGGFCFYYYWFNGKRLLRKPLDLFLKNRELDFKYCICWANESWTRRWDGLEQEILMEQEHNETTDVKFIYDMIPMFKDQRYIKIDGKPLLLIYRMELFPEPAKTIERWRQICRKEDVGEIHISIVQSFDQISMIEYGADSATEFPPHKINMCANICINDDMKDKDDFFEGNIYSYETTVKNLTNIVKRDYCLMQGSMLEWDNTARRKYNSNIFTDFSPEMFRLWCIKNKFYTKLYNYNSGNCSFINAWNEWAEGSYLEPDKKYGKTMLEITNEVSKLK